MQPPGGGYQYPIGGPAPIPTPRRAGPGCLAWGLAGCGVVLVILLIVGGITASQFSRSKLGGQLSSQLKSMVDSPTRLKSIDRALEAYKIDHAGKYPASLKDLSPSYLPASPRVAGSDASPAPLEYTRPGPRAPSDFVVVRVSTLKISAIQTQVQTVYTCLLKNGSIVQEQVVRTQLMPPRPGSP